MRTLQFLFLWSANDGERATRDITPNEGAHVVCHVSEPIIKILNAYGSRHTQDLAIYDGLYLMLTTKPYKELAERTFYVRLSILTSQREPTFALGILGLELHEEEMDEEFAHVVRASFAPVVDANGVVTEEIPDVLIGSFSVNS